MSKFVELSNRCEKAAGPDRILDLAISVAVNFKDVFDPVREWKWSTFADEIVGYKDGKRSGCLDPAQFVPQWTGSIDAAIKLIPAGKYWSISHGRLSAREPHGAARIVEPKTIAIIAESEAETVALALCAACLRARAEAVPPANQPSAEAIENKGGSQS